jgi:hypothetical protein
MTNQFELSGVCENIALTHEQLTSFRNSFFAHIKICALECDYKEQVITPVALNGRLYKLRTYGEWTEHDGVDHYECIDAELQSNIENVWWGLNTDWFHTRFRHKDFAPINF